MAASFAFVTLLTTDSYLPGALVTAHSLREAEGPTPSIPFDTVCIVTPETVGVESIKALRKVFSLVVGVEEIRSQSQQQLELLGRRDLASSITKIHLWRLIQYQKLIFLDADTLVLRPLSHLFALPQPFAAAPDSGWPDCFNSGMMVCTPGIETFDNLLNMTEERGSWDGGDQGLLNDYFTTWHRLSFTFNVTPSAYYTYTPAYRRHGHNISLVHFIGSEKPWHRLNRHRPASGTTALASDYGGLVNRWFDVYERAYGPVSTAAVGFTSGPQGPFTVPVYTAAWDAAKPSRYTPPSTDQLKAMFTRQGGISPAFANPELLASSAAEGAYLSLPMPGRPSLMRRLGQQPPGADQSGPLPASAFAADPPQPPPQPQPQNNPAQPPSPGSSSKSVRFAPSPPRSPPHQVWDPAHNPPPTTGHQMSVPFNDHYDSVWDEPKAKQKATFRPPTSYASIPSITFQDYSRTASLAPDASAVKAVFPWEKEQGSSRPTRKFPEDEPPRPLPDISKARTPSELQAAVTSAPVSAAMPMTMRYTNAWDAIPHIKKYVDSLQPRPSRSGRGSQGLGKGKETSPAAGSPPGVGERGRLKPKDRPSPQAPFSERESDASSRDGDDEDDVDDESDGESPAAPRQRGVPANGPSAAAKISPPISTASAGLASQLASRRPHLNRGAGSAGSLNRLPTVKSVIVGVPAVKGEEPPSPGLAPDALLRPKDLKERARNLPVSPLFTPARTPAPSSNQANGSQTNAADAGPAKPSRVFSPTTDTGTLKQSGLDALKRFVRDMEKNGGSGSSTPPSNGNGGGSSRHA